MIGEQLTKNNERNFNDKLTLNQNILLKFIEFSHQIGKSINSIINKFGRKKYIIYRDVRSINFTEK